MPDDEPPAPPASRAAPPRSGCCWPLWDDQDRPDGRFCDNPRVPGRPYCTAHCRRAYSTFPRRAPEEEAA